MNLTPEQQAVVDARQWRKNTTRDLCEQVPRAKHQRAICPSVVAQHAAPKQDTGTPGQVNTNGETGFYSYLSVAG